LNTSTRKILIPFELAAFAVWQRSRVTAYETNAVIKALDTWLVLKHETRSGLLQQWNDQKHYLFTLCKCSESIFRERLKLLRSMKLVEFDRHNIRVCSWEDLSTALEIDISNKFELVYDIHNPQKLYQWIIATEIKYNQNKQDYKIIKKVNENPLKKQCFVSAMLLAGADPARLKDTGYFLSWLNILYREDFVKASAIHDLLIEIRPDHNRGVKTMADHWKAKSPMTVCYWKTVLKKAGIADISSLQIESIARVRNNQCKVLWLKKSFQTLLCLCDDISILEPWKIQNLMAA
jgi:hypothetical protein